MQATHNRPIVTIEQIRALMGTKTYDAVHRERAITDARADAARRLDVYHSERGAVPLPDCRDVSVTTMASSDADVASC
jgi:phage gp36-like protein